MGGTESLGDETLDSFRVAAFSGFCVISNKSLNAGFDCPPAKGEVTSLPRLTWRCVVSVTEGRCCRGLLGGGLVVQVITKRLLYGHSEFVIKAA